MWCMMMVILPTQAQTQCNTQLMEGYMVFFEIEDNHTLYFSSQLDGSKIVYNNSSKTYTTNLPGLTSLNPNACVIIPPGVTIGLQYYEKHPTDNEVVSSSITIQWDDNKSVPNVKVWNGIETKILAYNK